jgi:hypothetical protein
VFLRTIKLLKTKKQQLTLSSLFIVTMYVGLWNINIVEFQIFSLVQEVHTKCEKNRRTPYDVANEKGHGGRSAGRIMEDLYGKRSRDVDGR